MEEDVKEAFDDIRRHFEAAVERFVSMHDDTRRHFDVAAEGLKHEIRLIAEGLQHVDHRVGRTETRLDSLDRKFDRLETKVDVLDTKVDGIDRKLDAALDDLRPRVERLEKPN